MNPGEAPRNMSEETLAEHICRVADQRLHWPFEVFDSKIEPIENEL